MKKLLQWKLIEVSNYYSQNIGDLLNVLPLERPSMRVNLHQIGNETLSIWRYTLIGIGILTPSYSRRNPAVVKFVWSKSGTLFALKKVSVAFEIASYQLYKMP